MEENSLTDIFTDIDDNIFSDGSIDPMGILRIWTSLGNKIFESKLNTVSTDIRFYTLNLFHHTIINQCEKLYEDRILSIIGKSPYNNREDLRDGLIIFMECLLTHAMASNLSIVNDAENYSVPGISKLKGLLLNKPNDPRVKYITIDKKEGILVRQILLGIHGRHKGPFQQIGIFDKNDYYANRIIWSEAGNLFSTKEWMSLSNRLTNIINEEILNAKFSEGNYLKVRVDKIISRDLIELYLKILTKSNFVKGRIVNFWESNLGLKKKTAGIIYNEIVNSKPNDTYEQIIKRASIKGNIEDNDQLGAICAIEPFLTCITKSMNRLLVRGTSNLDEDIINFLKNWLFSNNVDLELINKYLNAKYMDEEALLRLQKLILMYNECKVKEDGLLFAHRLINYHKSIMNDRGNLAWISIGQNNNLTQHRSYNFSMKEINELANTNWVNNYYLPTVKSLYNGLYNLDETI